MDISRELMERLFPKLGVSQYRITSQASKDYNCIAWAAGDDSRWWEPDPWNLYYWPPSAPRTWTLDALVQAYGTLGFKLCFDGGLEQGLEKVAIYAKGQVGNEVPTHAALQLRDGTWTSKLGNCEDINHHTSGDVNGPEYGQVFCFLVRLRV